MEPSALFLRSSTSTPPRSLLTQKRIDTSRPLSKRKLDPGFRIELHQKDRSLRSSAKQFGLNLCQTRRPDRSCSIHAWRTGGCRALRSALSPRAEPVTGRRHVFQADSGPLRGATLLERLCLMGRRRSYARVSALVVRPGRHRLDPWHHRRRPGAWLRPIAQATRRCLHQAGHDAHRADRVLRRGAWHHRRWRYQESRSGRRQGGDLFRGPHHAGAAHRHRACLYRATRGRHEHRPTSARCFGAEHLHRACRRG